MPASYGEVGEMLTRIAILSPFAERVGEVVVMLWFEGGNISCYWVFANGNGKREEGMETVWGDQSFMSSGSGIEGYVEG